MAEKILLWGKNNAVNSAGGKYCREKILQLEENTAMEKYCSEYYREKENTWGVGWGILLWKKYCNEYCREKENTVGGEILQGKNTVMEKILQ